MTRVFCQQCRFWESAQTRSPTKSKEGRCRRHAPVPNDTLIDHYATQWPATFDDDWCGEAVLRTNHAFTAITSKFNE